MGIFIDPNQPYTEDQKRYLRERGRGHQIAANERRFGKNGDENNSNADAGQPEQNPFYDQAVRNQATVDVGGVPLPGTVLDYDTGRVFDRENGVHFDPTGMGHTNSATNFNQEGFEESGDEGDVDPDIVDDVMSIGTIKELKARLESEGIPLPKSNKRDDLLDALAIGLQDKRDIANGKAVATETDPENGESDSEENDSDENDDENATD